MPLDPPETRAALKEALVSELVSGGVPVDRWAHDLGLPYIDVMDVLEGKGCPSTLDRNALHAALGLDPPGKATT